MPSTLECIRRHGASAMPMFGGELLTLSSFGWPLLIGVVVKGVW
jgi:hypothetical protein